MEKALKNQELQREQEVINTLIGRLQAMLEAFALQTSELEKQKAKPVPWDEQISREMNE